MTCFPSKYTQIPPFIFTDIAFNFTSGNIAARIVLSNCCHSALYNTVTDVMNHLSLAQFFSKSSTAHSKGSAHEEWADLLERETQRQAGK